MFCRNGVTNIPIFITFQLLLDIILVILIWVLQKHYVFIMFCILTVLLVTLLKLLINLNTFFFFWSILSNFLHNHFICEQNQFYLFLLNHIYRISFIWCYCLSFELPVQYWKGVLRGTILALFPILLGKIHVSHQ